MGKYIVRYFLSLAALYAVLCVLTVFCVTLFGIGSGSYRATNSLLKKETFRAELIRPWTPEKPFACNADGIGPKYCAPTEYAVQVLFSTLFFIAVAFGYMFILVPYNLFVHTVLVLLAFPLAIYSVSREKRS
jgi:hypothetical protein